MKLKKLFDMTGRQVLITGGAGHIGMVIAETLSQLGAKIILLDRPSDRFEVIKNELRCMDVKYIECDIESEKQRNIAIKTIKSDRDGLNCLVNNAAFGGDTSLEGWITTFEKQSLSTWRRALEVNLTAPFHFAQALAPMLSKAEGGNILNITSIYGHYAPDMRLYEGTKMGNPAAYSASKGGLVQLTRWLSTVLSPEIRVNGISPGGVYRSQPKEFIERYKFRTPLGRMATEEDFRAPVALLTSDAGSYITGQILEVEGGWGVW
jgi:NAD(P)-dependent dehydrogenase (short-subunit alcohol dehydrogenase family)